MIGRDDRQLLDGWYENGIPDDFGTRNYALLLLLKLWREHKSLLDQVDGLILAIGEAS